jgi:hypothetical protein
MEQKPTPVQWKQPSIMTLKEAQTIAQNKQ